MDSVIGRASGRNCALQASPKKRKKGQKNKKNPRRNQKKPKTPPPKKTPQKNLFNIKASIVSSSFLSFLLHYTAHATRKPQQQRPRLFCFAIDTLFPLPQSHIHHGPPHLPFPCSLPDSLTQPPRLATSSPPTPLLFVATLNCPPCRN